MPFQQILVLEFDGHVLAQSQAIAAYAAEITGKTIDVKQGAPGPLYSVSLFLGLCGATPLDRAKARMFAEGAMEAYVEGAWYYFESDKEKKVDLPPNPLTHPFLQLLHYVLGETAREI